MAISESVHLVLVFEQLEYLKTLLKNGSSFGQMKLPFRQLQPDCIGLLQASFSRPSCHSLIVHRWVSFLHPIAVLLIPRVIELRDLKVALALLDLALSGADLKVAEAIAATIALGQREVLFQQPQPDCKGLLQDSFSKPCVSVIVVH